MDKVFVVTSEVVTYDDFNSNVEGVFTNEDSAKKRMMEAIERMCECQKENLECDYEDEADELGYDSFEEYWSEWVNEGFVTPNFWRYTDDDMTIVIAICPRDVEE